MRDLRQRRMRPEQHGHEREAAEDEQQREALEAAEIAGAGSGDDDRGGGDYAQFLRQAEIVERQADADELGDDGEGVQEEEIDDAESAPELAEALEDQPRM